MSRVTIIADQVQLLGGKSEGAGNTGNGAPRFVPADNTESTPAAENNGDFPEDIPF